MKRLVEKALSLHQLFAPLAVETPQMMRRNIINNKEKYHK
jgi:hypothetical protein